jgi:hypothetical protein
VPRVLFGARELLQPREHHFPFQRTPAPNEGAAPGTLPGGGARPPARGACSISPPPTPWRLLVVGQRHRALLEQLHLSERQLPARELVHVQRLHDRVFAACAGGPRARTQSREIKGLLAHSFQIVRFPVRGAKKQNTSNAFSRGHVYQRCVVRKPPPPPRARAAYRPP